MYLFIFILISPCALAQFVGLADINLKRLEKCGEDMPNFNLSMEMRKTNRTHFGVDINLSTPIDLDEQVACNLTAAKWGDGGWKPNAMDLYDSNGCMLVKTYADRNFKEVLEIFGHPVECPIKKGSYRASNYIFGSDWSLPIMYGELRFDLIFTKDGMLVTCLRAYMDAKPKKSIMG